MNGDHPIYSSPSSLFFYVEPIVTLEAALLQIWGVFHEQFFLLVEPLRQRQRELILFLGITGTRTRILS